VEKDEWWCKEEVKVSEGEYATIKIAW